MKRSICYGLLAFGLLLPPVLNAMEMPVPNRTEELSNTQHVIALQQREVERLTKAIADFTDEYKRLDPLRGEHLLRALPTFSFHDATLNRLVPKYHDALFDELALLRSGLGTKDLKVEAAHALEEDCARELETWIENIKNSMRIRIDVTKQEQNAALTNLKTLLDKSV